MFALLGPSVDDGEGEVGGRDVHLRVFVFAVRQGLRGRRLHAGGTHVGPHGWVHVGIGGLFWWGQGVLRVTAAVAVVVVVVVESSPKSGFVLERRWRGNVDQSIMLKINYNIMNSKLALCFS